MDLTGAVWRKSSHSGSNGGDCIELAAWRKSTRSSTNGGQCVELQALPGVVAVRDSKDPEGPVLAFSHADWRAFSERLKQG